MSDHVTDVPWKDHMAHIRPLAAADPSHVYYAQVIPPGYDAEADRLRALGMVQVFRCERPVKVREIDRELHRLIRKA